MTPASWINRVGGTLIDNVLITAGVVGCALVAAADGVPGAVVGVAVAVAVALWLLYAPLMLALAGGQTLGKKASNVRVVLDDGRPIGLGRAFLRETTKFVFALFTLPWIIDALWPLWEPQKRALHDLLFSTRVLAT